MKSVRSGKKNGFILVAVNGEESKLLPFAELNENANELIYALPTQKIADIPEEAHFQDVQKFVIINQLKTELLRVHKRGKLVQLLAYYLPLINIKATAIVFQKNRAESYFVGGFSGAGALYEEQQLFSAKNLVPQSVEEAFKKGLYLVHPLTTDGRAFGYVIFGNAECDFAVYEDLRDAISSTVQSVYLFEELTEAKQAAERAEREKTEFFANVGNDLCDPLKDLSAKITQMESNIEKGVLDADILTEQLLFLKSQIASQLEKTETLVELTRTQVEDLPMDKKLFDLTSILPEAVVRTLDTPLPLLFGDKDRLQKALQILLEKSNNNVSVTAAADGIHLGFESATLDWQSPKLLLAEKIILLQYGEMQKSHFSATVVLPYPNLAGTAPAKGETLPQKIHSLSNTVDVRTLFQLPVEAFTREEFDALQKNDAPYLFYWNPDAATVDEWIKIYGMRHNDVFFKMPLVCYGKSLIGQRFLDVLAQKVNTKKTGTVLFIHAERTHYGSWATEENTVSIPSMAEFDKIMTELTPSLIVFEDVDEAGIKKIRQNTKTVFVPILVLPKTIASEAQVEKLCSHPRIILCNQGVAESDLFDKRIREILAGDEILPPHTGALVKRAIYYLNKNVSQQIVRWKLADTIHVSEDYLTRIFHKELGFSLWEYLNRYRMYIATRMLLETNDTIYEIAENAGFQDQAYFCRVFKKVYGIPPGKIRTKQ